LIDNMGKHILLATRFYNYKNSLTLVV